MRSTCSIEGCNRIVNAHGWCQMHYKRWRKHGDPLHEPKRLTLAERFWPKVDRRGIDECWEWIGSRLPEPWSYGQMTPCEGERRAHRISWILNRGSIPAGMLVLHSCDNPPCCNPAHLFLGTQALNMADKVAKGRDHESIKRHCPHGHEYTPANTAPNRGGRGRRCRTCKNERARRARAAR